MIDRKLDQSAMSPLGRYSCKAQGASPGLIVSTHFLSSVGAALSAQVLGVVVMLYLSVGAFIRSVVPLLIGALNFCVPIYPGFHIGLCPHSTLGFAGVPCLKALTPALPNKSDNKHKQRHCPINPTTNANNDTAQ